MRPATAVALALALTACASGNSGSVGTDAKSAVMLKVADDTRAGGDPAGALAMYRGLHETAPNDPVPLVRIGATAMELADYADAVTAYRAALAIDPKDLDSHRGLALVLLAQGHPEEAINELNAALALNRDDPRIYNGLGVAHDMLGQYADAQKDYRDGLKLAPTNANLRNNFGMSQALAGNFDGAIATLEGLGSIADAPARFRLNLALAYGLAGNDEKAALVARHVLDEQSVKNNLEYYAMLRAMDAKSRAAAIIGAQLHGSATASAAVKPTDTALATPPAAAPQVPVQATLLPVPAPQPPNQSKADVVNPPTKMAAGDATPAPSTAPHHKHRKAVANPAAAALEKTNGAQAAESASKSRGPTPAASAAPTKVQAASDLPAAPGTIRSDANPADSSPAATTIGSPPVAASPAAMVASARGEPHAEVEPAAGEAPAVGLISTLADGWMDRIAPAAFALKSTAAEPVAEAFDPARATSDVAGSISLALSDVAAAVAAPTWAGVVNGGNVQRRSRTNHVVVQLGSYLLESSARKVMEECAAHDIEVNLSRKHDRNGRAWFTVRTAEFASSDEAAPVLRQIARIHGVAPILLKHRMPSA